MRKQVLAGRSRQEDQESPVFADLLRVIDLIFQFLSSVLPVWFDGPSGVQWGFKEQQPLPGVR
jgi:hypothetical protein